MNLYKSCFKSKIGILYYIWTNTSSSKSAIIFLSNSNKNLVLYLKNLNSKISPIKFTDKKAVFIEKIITGYLERKKKEIDLKYIFLTGSDFEKNIWRKTAEIPYGQVLSYKEVAENAGYPAAWRAAGTALGNNPLMLIIPCHRVIKSSGEIGRYGGGEKVKEFLLKHEAG
jgi:O-6-methylguanine DNA methyltransferase